MTEQITEKQIPYPDWVWNPNPRAFVKWLDDVHGLELKEEFITEEHVQMIAKARKRDGTLSTLAMMGEQNTVNSSVIHVMAEATEEGTHHLTQGEWSTPLEWFMSKVEPGDDEQSWSQSMMYELQNVMNVVMPALHAAGFTTEQVMEITKQDSKARAAVSTIRPYLNMLIAGPNEKAKQKVQEIYDVITGKESVREAKKELARIRGVIEPEPIVIEEAWTSPNTSKVIVHLEDPVQRRAFRKMLDRLPHEEHTTTTIDMAKGLINLTDK